MKKIIYADYAATTPLLTEALEAMLPWLKDERELVKNLCRFKTMRAE